LIWSPRRDCDIGPSAQARLVAQAKAHEEHRRLLYVALTRAQDCLLVAGHWFGPGGDAATGYHEDSWYALCRNAMEQLPARALEDGVLEYGAAARPLPEGGAAARGSTGADPSPVPPWALRAPGPDIVTRRLTAPTGLLGPGTRVVAPFDPKREARLKRGRLIHSLLQYLPELPLAARHAAGAAFLARERELTKAQRAEMLKSAEAILNDPALCDLFQPGGRAEAAVIGTSRKLPDDLVINGRVDRLVVTPTRVLVIDFKTDQPAPDDVSEVAGSYITQMAAYAAVLESAFPGREVVAVLCWTDGPKMMRIPPGMLSLSLNKALRPV
jgi:ATP-dependent helicase/nuclease subunit A